MSETLRRIVNTATFSTLQDKLERWLKDYYVSTDSNAKTINSFIVNNKTISSGFKYAYMLMF